MPLVTFSPNTKIKSNDMNTNLAGLSDGSLDTTGNSLAYLRRKEMINHLIGSGLTIATSASLATTIAAGEAIVNGKYLSQLLTNKTFTASKDTYVDLKDDGTYAYVEVANGATSGMTLTLNSDGSDAFRIAKVVTSASAVTSVQQIGIDPLGYQILNSNPVGIARWFRPTFQNSWTDYDTTVYGPVWYGKAKTGHVHIIGLIKNGVTTLDTVIFNLPAGYRPFLRQIYIQSSAAAGGTGRVDVQTNGDILVQTNVSATFTGLSGITFMATS